MNKNYKPVAYAVLLLILSAMIAFALEPIYLDWYFEHQDPLAISEAQSIGISRDPAILQYGKVIVVRGIVWDVWDDGILVSDSRHADLKLTVHKTELMNCMPQRGEIVTLAGAFNPEDNKTKFYGVWVVGGCHS